MAAKKRTKTQQKGKSFTYSPFPPITVFILIFSLIIIGAFFCLIYLTDIAVGGYTNPDEFYLICAMMVVAYVSLIAITLAADYLYQRSNFKRSLGKLNVKQTDDLPLGILATLYQPVAVCNDEGKIFWMNRSFATQSSKNILISENINLRTVLDFRKSEFRGKVIDEIKEKLNNPETNEEEKANLLPSPSDFSTREILDYALSHNCGFTASGQQGFGGDWTIRAYPFEANDSKFYILVLTEDTEYNKLNTKYHDDMAHIAYIAVDNLAELAQSDQENYRNASTQVAATIKKWAMDHCAFLKEFERDKYIAVLTDKELTNVEKGKFQLLEKVSNTKIDSERMAVTISVGVSPSNGTLEEKDKVAQSALEMALQRGGNQAVVMHNDQPKFYGAKTITSLQRSGVRHRVFAEKLMHKLNDCDNVIIMAHKTPDFDALGACVGIARLALSVKSPDDIAVVMNPDDPNLMECFTLLKRLPEYRYMFVDKTAAQDMIRTNTLLVCVDVNNPRNFEAEDIYKNCTNLYIIDHHRQSETTPKPLHGKREVLIVPSASSACELISEILELELPQNNKLSNEEATVMFSGIMLDTKNFTRNTQVPTFGAAIYLRTHGADPTKAQSLFRVDFNDFRQESSFASDLEIYKDFVVIAKEDSSESSPAKRITAAKTADKLLNIKNARASFVISRMGNDVFISARSDGSVNVQLIMENMGGGGHYNAAATWIKETSINDASENLKSSIDMYFGYGVSEQDDIGD